jgi:P-type Mg2+ transporter
MKHSTSAPTPIVAPPSTVRPISVAAAAAMPVAGVVIRRFMLVFGPISSLFDFATFAVMLWVFHADETLFHTGWFVESLATQTLVLFVIRTRRSPFFRSYPSVPLLTAALAAVATGALLPATPLARGLGFSPLPGGFFLAWR